MLEVAKLANVSIGTVGRALNGRDRIRESTRQRILQIAQELGYKPNLAARVLSVGGTFRMGVCIPKELRLFYDQVRHGIFSEARRYEHIGLDIVYRPSDRLGEGEVERVQELIGSGIKALIVTPGHHKRLTPLINKSEEQGIRVICVATDAPTSNRSSVVCVEPEMNGKLAGELMEGSWCPAHKLQSLRGCCRPKITARRLKDFPMCCREPARAQEWFRSSKAMMTRMKHSRNVCVYFAGFANCPGSM